MRPPYSCPFTCTTSCTLYLGNFGSSNIAYPYNSSLYLIVNIVPHLASRCRTKQNISAILIMAGQPLTYSATNFYIAKIYEYFMMCQFCIVMQVILVALMRPMYISLKTHRSTYFEWAAPLTNENKCCASKFQGNHGDSLWESPINICKSLFSCAVHVSLLHSWDTVTELSMSNKNGCRREAILSTIAVAQMKCALHWYHICWDCFNFL